MHVEKNGRNRAAQGASHDVPYVAFCGKMRVPAQTAPMLALCASHSAAAKRGGVLRVMLMVKGAVFVSHPLLTVSTFAPYASAMGGDATPRWSDCAAPNLVEEYVNMERLLAVSIVRTTESTR